MKQSHCSTKGLSWVDELQPPSINEVRKLITSMSGKSSPVDHIPTSAMKSCVDVFAALIAHLTKLSFSYSNVSQQAGTDPCTTSSSALFRYSDARRSSHTHRTGPSRFFCCCSIHLELSTYWHSTVRKHSHFQTPLENPSIQTHLVLLCCIKRFCIFGPKGTIQIRYYYYYYYY